MLIAYNLLRHEMANMAAALMLPPQRLSFQWMTLAITMAFYHWPLQTPERSPTVLTVYASRRATTYCLNAESALIREY